MFLGSGTVSISVRGNLVFKGRVDRSLAKRSKRQALKRARRVIEGYGPWISLGNVKNFMAPQNARSEARPACGTSRSTEELDGTGENE